MATDGRDGAHGESWRVGGRWMAPRVSVQVEIASATTPAARRRRSTGSNRNLAIQDLRENDDWISKEATEKAHRNPVVAEMWDQFDRVCDYVACRIFERSRADILGIHSYPNLATSKGLEVERLPDC